MKLENQLNQSCCKWEFYWEYNIRKSWKRSMGWHCKSPADGKSPWSITIQMVSHPSDGRSQLTNKVTEGVSIRLEPKLPILRLM